MYRRRLRCTGSLFPLRLFSTRREIGKVPDADARIRLVNTYLRVSRPRTFYVAATREKPRFAAYIIVPAPGRERNHKPDVRCERRYMIDANKKFLIILQFPMLYQQQRPKFSLSSALNETYENARHPILPDRAIKSFFIRR